MYLCDFLFLKRDWSRDSKIIQKSMHKYISNKWPVWLVSYVEGHRANPAKIASSQAYAISHGLPKLEHLLIPRTKGFLATVEPIRGSHIKHIYDVTVAFYSHKSGFGHTPSISDVFLGHVKEYRIHVHVERIPIDTIPQDSKACTQWLLDLYLEKDDLLSRLKTAFSQ